jgi:hypothetical protein
MSYSRRARAWAAVIVPSPLCRIDIIGGRSLDRGDPVRRFRGGEYCIWYWAVRVKRSSEVIEMKTIPSWTLEGCQQNPGNPWGCKAYGAV